MSTLRFLRVFVSVVLTITITGCATEGSWYDDWRNCAMAGAVAGAGMGSTNDTDAALVGGAVGAVVGGLMCAAIDPPDSDGDGVPDDKDQCPGTPLGATVDEFGCELDSDGDGVVDRLDQCPNTPKGTKVDQYGCALIIDTDGDGVPDDRDFCPGTEPGIVVNEIGCDSTKPTLLRGVNFKHDSSELAGNSSMVLDDAAARLVLYPQVKVEIVGHTDNQGAAEYNKSLSDRRAQSVHDYLVSKGVKDDNISALGMGEDDPIADNATREGRAQNRRVQIKVMH